MSKKLKRTNLFAKDVSSLLYAYGDAPQPLPETVQCLDELVSAYLVDVCAGASRSAQNSRRSKLKLEDFKFVLRHDPIKLGRAEELIATNKLIAEAKKQFNGTDSQNLKRYREGEEGGEGGEYEDQEEDEDVDGEKIDDEYRDASELKKNSTDDQEAQPREDELSSDHVKRNHKSNKGAGSKKFKQLSK